MGLGKLKKVEVESTAAVLKELNAVLKELNDLLRPNPGEGQCEITAYYDKADRLRRVVARYQNGWRVQLNIDAAGFVTSQSARLKLVSADA